MYNSIHSLIECKLGADYGMPLTVVCSRQGKENVRLFTKLIKYGSLSNIDMLLEPKSALAINETHQERIVKIITAPEGGFSYSK